MDDRKYWIWLTMVFGIGGRRIWQAMSFFETPDEAYYELRSGNSVLRLNEDERNTISSVPISQAEMIMSECEKKGIDIVSYTSTDYPPQIRHIMNPPAILYYKGNIRCLKGTKTITSVGTRKASEYSVRAASKICSDLAKSGVVIVSGFAVGIDIASHMAAASNGLPTACVLGCGVDVDYPYDNFKYRDPILEAGGVFVTEYQPGTTPHPGNFPKRNRILAALGRATIVFEASERSGSLITATLSAEQGREVFCLPPADIFSKAYSGNALLISEGAVPFFSAEDILSCFGYGTELYDEVKTDAYSIIENDAIPSEKTDVFKSEAPSDEVGEKVRTLEKEEVLTEKKDEILLEGVQQKIAEVLSEGALHADILAQRLELDPSELMTELTEMEIMGAVRSLPGKIYEKCL